VLQASTPELGKAIAIILMEEEFKPALCNSVPCAMGYQFNLSVR
jgi:hypothetical protein